MNLGVQNNTFELVKFAEKKELNYITCNISMKLQDSNIELMKSISDFSIIDEDTQTTYTDMTFVKYLIKAEGLITFVYCKQLISH